MATTLSSAELMRSVLTEDPARASRVAASAGVEPSAIEGDLDNVLSKALKKSPSERYLSAGAFADDLRHYLNHEPVSAHADSALYRIARFTRRHRTGVVVGSLVTAALVAAIAFALIQLFEARAQRDAARYEATHASAQVELTEFLLGDSMSQAPREVLGRRLERARALIQRRFRNEPAIEASLMTGLSGRFIDAGDYKGGADIMQEVEAISRRLDDPHLNADIACGKAQDAVEVGDLRAAHEQEAIGLSNLHRLNVVDAEQAVECTMAGAYIAERERDYAKAISAMRTAMTALEKAGITRTSRYTSIAHEYARSLSLAGNYRAAWSAEQSVMNIVADVGRDDSDAYYAMVNVDSTVLLAGGQPRKSLELLETTIQRTRQATPDASLPFYLNASVLLARTAAGAPGAGDGGLMQAANLTPADKQDSDPEWQQILALRARIELAQRNYAAAAADAQLAMERAGREAIDPKSSAWVGEALVLRAESESAAGNTAAAAASAQRALPHLLENLDPSHPLIAEAGKLARGAKLASGTS